MQLRRVARHDEVMRHLDLELYAFVKRARNEVFYLVDECLHIDRALVMANPPSQPEQLFGQIGRSFDGELDVPETCLHVDIR